VGEDPTREIYSVGRGTFLGELLSIAVGENILQDAASLYPKISKEYLINQSPEFIIEVGPNPIHEKEALEKRKAGWQRFPTIRAVKNDNIHYLGGDYLLKPGPRLLQIIDHFIAALHPEIINKAVVTSTDKRARQ
jgi:iron complex transport system substrate-binding protein